jgi:hypothetical protein
VSLESDIAEIVHLIRSDVQIVDVQGDEQSSGWISDDMGVTFQIVGFLRRGVDERRAAVEGDSLRERIYGFRTMRVQFTCDGNRQTLGLTAPEVADALIAGFNRTDIEEILAGQNLGVPWCTAVRQTDYQNIHGDARSAATFEAQFPASRRVAGGLVVPIKSIEVTGTPGPIDTTIGPV